MADLIRAATITGYFETMAGLGVDPRPLLKEQGIRADVISEPGQFIPAFAAMNLLERSAEVTGCLTLGLRMAEVRTLASLGATSLLIAHQPTLRKALCALTEYRSRINSTLVLNFEQFGDETILREDFSLKRPIAVRQSSNLALGVLAQICNSVLGDCWSPLSVCITHEAPPSADMQIFTRLFRCKPEFNSEFNGIVIRSADLDRPNPKADDQLALHARRLLETAMTPATRTVTQDVDQLIKLLLPSGKASIQTCATSMGLTVRTLQRMLDTEGTVFTELLNRARMQLATQYLANPRMRVTDISDILGYSSIGAFSRWHKQAFGMSPRQGRKQLLHQGV
ncbi:MAG: AraC family transcriptional regulator [Sphingomonadaceae bacterium]